MDCYLCSETLTTHNDSAEHIIPNSIGGFKKVKGFICRECNNKSGSTWDTEVSKQFNKLALFFQVERDQGDISGEVIETTAGEKLIYRKNALKSFSPRIDKTEIEGGVQYRISANDMKQAREIITGLKRKHPAIDIEKTLSNATEQVRYPEGYFQFEFSFGGLSAGKSFVKTALALLSANGINPRICERANSYMLLDGEPCFGHYYHSDLIINRPMGVPLHCICVKGNKAERTIQAYLEYFGVARLVISLSAQYEGEDFKYSYAINPTNGEELFINFNLNFNECDIRKIYDYQFYDEKMALACWDAVIPTQIERRDQQHLEEVLTRVRKTMTRRFRDRTNIPLEEFATTYVECLEPYILHISKSANKSIPFQTQSLLNNLWKLWNDRDKS